MILGFMFGCWDLLHEGHIDALKFAKEHCDTLIVGVYSDKVVEGYKGRTPTITEIGRARTVYNLDCVDSVRLIVDRPSKLDFKDVNRLFVSEEWKGKKLPFLPKTFKGDIIYVPYTDGISTSIVRERLIKSSEKFVKRQRQARKRGKT